MFGLGNKERDDEIARLNRRIDCLKDEIAELYRVVGYYPPVRLHPEFDPRTFGLTLPGSTRFAGWSRYKLTRIDDAVQGQRQKLD